MGENIIGTYECDECNSMWFIRSTGITAYDGWLPCCPVCGLEDTVRQVEV